MSETSEGPGRAFYSRQEFRLITGLGQNSLDNAIRHGIIPSVKIGRRILIPKAAVEKLVSLAVNAGRGDGAA